jgi:hypothetical protein
VQGNVTFEVELSIPYVDCTSNQAKKQDGQISFHISEFTSDIILQTKREDFHAWIRSNKKIDALMPSKLARMIQFQDLACILELSLFVH